MTDCPEKGSNVEMQNPYAGRRERWKRGSSPVWTFVICFGVWLVGYACGWCGGSRACEEGDVAGERVEVQGDE